MGGIDRHLANLFVRLVISTAATTSVTAFTTITASISAARFATWCTGSSSLAASAASLGFAHGSILNIQSGATTAAAATAIEDDVFLWNIVLAITTAATATIAPSVITKAATSRATSTALDSANSSALAARTAGLGITDSSILDIQSRPTTAAATAFPDLGLTEAHSDHSDDNESTARRHYEQRPPGG